MADYKFHTIWEFGAPRERIWRVLEQPESWPSWWQGLVEVKKLSEGSGGIGTIRRYTLQAPFGYTLAFQMKTTFLEPMQKMGGDASGDLEGSGRWELEDVSSGTRVHYHWLVRTKKGWMNWLEPILRPVFACNHKRAMEKAGKGLAKHVEASSFQQEHRLE
jgi:uncharacterized protein YndB with AHSA1/START domain